MPERNKLTQKIDLLSLITQAPVSLVGANGETIYCPTIEDHHYLSQDMAQEILESYQKKDPSESTPYIYLFSLVILQGVVRLNKKEYLFVGPVSITHCSLEYSLDAFLPYVAQEEALRLHGLLEKFVPLDFFRFSGILAAVSNEHNNSSYTPSDVINANFLRNIQLKEFDQSSYTNANMIPIASINFFQQTLYSIIAAGNMDALVKHWQNDLINTLINLNLKIDDMNFLCIPFYTFMFQGALNGGAEVQVCFDKYVEQTKRFKGCLNIVECITELKRASYEYCNLVNDHSKQEYMLDVCNLCVSYINDHIQEKITVDDLSHVSGMHRNKLYTIFRANFGMTISEYIEKERLRRALTFLKSSNYKISEIASTMGYSNQSHFTLIFKKHYGCTPGQYIKAQKRSF